MEMKKQTLNESNGMYELWCQNSQPPTLPICQQIFMMYQTILVTARPFLYVYIYIGYIYI